MSIPTKHSSEAVSGGFRDILKIEGVLEDINVKPSKFEKGYGDKPARDQAEFVLHEAIILEMKPGAPEPDLQDDTFKTWQDYAPKGQLMASKHMFFGRYCLPSAEALDAKRRGVDVKEGRWENLKGTRVILEKVEKPMGKVPVDPKDPTSEKKEVFKTDFVFCLDEESSSATNIVEHIKKLVVGQKKPVALRALNIDSRAKQYPQYIEALKNEKLAEMLGLEVVDGIFMEPKEPVKED